MDGISTQTFIYCAQLLTHICVSLEVMTESFVAQRQSLLENGTHSPMFSNLRFQTGLKIIGG